MHHMIVPIEFRWLGGLRFEKNKIKKITIINKNDSDSMDRNVNPEFDS